MFISANVIQEAFSPLISVFQSILVFIHNHIVGTSWGLAIVGLTVLIRAVLVPLTLKQFRSMQELQRLAPQLKALQEKYKDDKQRQQQEIMGFYKEHKVNPFASCLPLLLQLPVFISLFYMLRTDLKKHICGHALVSHYNSLHHTTIATFAGLPTKYVEQTGCQAVAPGSAKFLFIPDITAKATGVALVVLLVLYVGSQLASTMIMSATADPDPAAPDDGSAAVLRDHPLPISGGAAGVLDHHEPVDGRSGLLRQAQLWTASDRAARQGSRSPGDEQALDQRQATGRRMRPEGEPAFAGAGGGGTPPPPPRKKKKRSGRRR